MGQSGTKQVDITWGDRVFPFHCFANRLSIEIARQIFAGETYRPIPYLRDVRLIADIGANIGAASVFLHTKYPEARIVAVEPSPVAFALLSRNAAPFAQIEAKQTALYDKKASLPLRTGLVDSVTNSFGDSALTKRKGDENS